MYAILISAAILSQKRQSSAVQQWVKVLLSRLWIINDAIALNVAIH